MVGENTFGSYIWMGDHSGIGTKTGPARDPSVGAVYCLSGTTTNENCGKKVVSLDGTFCDASGCTSGLAAYTGGNGSEGGDSGGPLVLKGGDRVYPRGIHIARTGNVMYAERWESISNYFGVTSVTSP